MLGLDHCVYVCWGFHCFVSFSCCQSFVVLPRFLSCTAGCLSEMPAPAPQVKTQSPHLSCAESFHWNMQLNTLIHAKAKLKGNATEVPEARPTCHTARNTSLPHESGITHQRNIIKHHTNLQPQLKRHGEAIKMPSNASKTASKHFWSTITYCNKRCQIVQLWINVHFGRVLLAFDGISMLCLMAFESRFYGGWWCFNCVFQSVFRGRCFWRGLQGIALEIWSTQRNTAELRNREACRAKDSASLVLSAWGLAACAHATVACKTRSAVNPEFA